MKALGDVEVGSFFSTLGSRLAEARAGDRRRYEIFFATLNARLDIARSAAKVLDRELAHRFNVFDFVDTSENGLSKIIRYLLDDGSHGQGTQFLRALLKGVQRDGWALEGCRISATTEQEAAGRRIDIVVEISSGRGRCCLAIENKPYASDQPKQLLSYFEYLDSKYGDDFLLVYLSRVGEAPSESSLPRGELDRMSSRFRILPYVRRQEDAWKDGLDYVRSREYSLVEWLEECRKLCEVDRVRWFLRDGERFCRQEFGEKTMSTDSEMQQVEEFVGTNPDYVRTAATVVSAWPRIRRRVIEEFTDALHRRIKGQAERGDGVSGDVEFLRLSEKEAYGLALTRGIWRAKHGRRAQIALVSENSGLDRWFFGVRQATADEGKLVGRLTEALGRKSGGDPNWHWWKWTEYRDWTVHVPQLAEELRQRTNDTVEGGRIMAYHVDQFLSIVEKALPVLDSLEIDGPVDE